MHTHAHTQTHTHTHTHTSSGLCPNDYPDEVCRSNTPLVAHDPPLLFNLNADPGELRPLDATKYIRVLEKIEMVNKKYCI